MALRIAERAQGRTIAIEEAMRADFDRCAFPMRGSPVDEQDFMLGILPGHDREQPCLRCLARVEAGATERAVENETAVGVLHRASFGPGACSGREKGRGGRIVCPKCRKTERETRSVRSSRDDDGRARSDAEVFLAAFARPASEPASTSLGRSASGAPGATPRGRRRRLWEMTNGWHCSLIGTCLRLGDLRRTAVRLGLHADAERLTDHELHGYFVHDAKTDGRVSRLLQKMLDAEHEGAVRRFSRCRDAVELARAWDEAVEKGEVAGAYWAAMTHPALDEALETRVFGEVHMMSHLAGASHRGEMRAAATATRERDGLAEKLRRSEADRLQAITTRDAEIARLTRALADAERRAEAMEVEAARLTAFLDPVAEAKRIAALEDASARVAQLERDAAEKGAVISEGAAERRRLHDENRDLLMELARAERALRAVAPADEDAETEIRVDLAGRRILYVGGRKSTVSHAKRLVERCNGCLLHHDGGLEQSVAELESNLMGADAVVFPVDCVSHKAIICVKRLCERRAMPFRALRSSGLGSLVDVLGDLAS